MISKNKNVILEVGSHDGLDGLALSLYNPNIYVYSFEPNKDLNKIYLKNKKKIENFFNIKIQNHQIIKEAVSNFDGISYFNISQNTALSSLNNFHKKNKFNDFFKSKIKVKTTKLSTFLIKEKIKNILYLHIDAQGSDLMVLKGLNKNIKNIYKGVIETAKDKKIQRYEGESTLKEVLKFFKLHEFIINKKVHNFNNFEFNIYFTNRNFIKDKNLIKVKTNYNPRFFRRIIDNKSNYKDLFFKHLLKIYTHIF